MKNIKISCSVLLILLYLLIANFLHAQTNYICLANRAEIVPLGSDHFVIIVDTGVLLYDDRGLKWKHIDWMRNKVRLYSKGQERLVTLHPTLRNMLLERKAELGDSWNHEDHVIRFIRDTLSTYFRRAIKKAGINKPGAVHILRHTSGTKLLASSKDIRITQEFLGHKNITTTEIYTHVIQEDMDKAVKEAFS